MIFYALVLNIVLVYFQLWRPFKAEEEIEEDIEAGDGLDEEGSSSACFCILPGFVLGIAAAVTWFIMNFDLGDNVMS